MFVRHKSEKEKREDAEIIELLKHMHQLDRNELIARVQQRDQYIVCIIGTFIAFLIGLIQAQSGNDGNNIGNTSNYNITSSFVWIVLGCMVALFLMVILTYRLVNSYDIHNQLINHTKLIDDFFKQKYSNKLRVLPWQEYVETHLYGHRKRSYNLTVIAFIITDILALSALLHVITMEIGNAIGFANIFSFSISMSISLFIVILLYLWEWSTRKDDFSIMPTLTKKLFPTFQKILIFILPFLLSLVTFLFHSIALHQKLLTNNSSWFVKYADVIALVLLLVMNSVVRTAVSGFAKPAYQTKANDLDVIIANYTGTCIFYVVFCIHFLTFKYVLYWIVLWIVGYYLLAGFGIKQFKKLINGIRQQSFRNTIIGFVFAYVIFWAYLNKMFTLPPEWFESAFAGLATGVVLSLIPMSIIVKVFDQPQSSSDNNANAKSEKTQEHG